MSDMKQFATAAKGRTQKEDRSSITFKVDEREVTAFKPKDGQLAMFMASVSGYSTEGEQAKGTIDFFINLFEADEDKIYFRDRLLSSDDDFDLDDLEDILYWVIAELAGRPTKPSSASTSQQAASGDGSTESSASVASTSSPSTPAPPAT